MTACHAVSQIAGTVASHDDLRIKIANTLCENMPRVGNSWTWDDLADAVIAALAADGYLITNPAAQQAMLDAYVERLNDGVDSGT